MRKIGLILVLVLSLGINESFAQEWQWSTQVTGVGNSDFTRAFLWVPTNCKQIRGIILAQHNMEEISILENPLFRKAMAEIGFAEIWVSPSPTVLKLFNFKEGAGEITNAYIGSLADISGYKELRNAPIVCIGHSAAASFPYYWGALNPTRTLACVSVSGQWPYVRNLQFAPDIWNKNQNLDFIPCIETMGEYESANSWSSIGLKQRQEHPLMPLSMLAAPAEGHFASSERKTAFLAFYIKKAAQFRLPDKQEGGKPVVLKPIDPTKSGWLADKWRLGIAPTAPAAPVGQYTGNASEAFWYFDEETVHEVEKYGAAFRGLKPQLVGYEQEGKMAPQTNSHLQVRLKFMPKKDGVTFNLNGAFYDTVPDGSPRLPMWTGLPVGSPIGHSQSGEPIVIERICGPFRKIAANTFMLQLTRGTETNVKKYVFTFAAKHPGDSEYKAAVQQGEMVIPATLTEGADQKITFPTILNQKANAKEIKLKATSDAGVPVYYYVQDGPAELDGNILKFTKIPPKAKYPVKVTVVAWQYGRSAEPKLKSAESVTQSFYIKK
jgi:hypothetical protein